MSPRISSHQNLCFTVGSSTKKISQQKEPVACFIINFLHVPATRAETAAICFILFYFIIPQAKMQQGWHSACVLSQVSQTQCFSRTTLPSIGNQAQHREGAFGFPFSFNSYFPSQARSSAQKVSWTSCGARQTCSVTPLWFFQGKGENELFAIWQQ